MKLLVETKDDLQVVGQGEELHARHNRPSVVRSIAFITSHVSSGNLVMLAQLTDDASDEEFAAEWAKADTDEKRAELKTTYASTYAPEGAKAKNDPPKK